MLWVIYFELQVLSYLMLGWGTREKVIGKDRKSVVGPLFNEPFQTAIAMQGMKYLNSVDKLLLQE